MSCLVISNLEALCLQKLCPRYVNSQNISIQCLINYACINSKSVNVFFEELYRIGNEVLFFSKDSKRRSYFIQVFNMDESRMIWEQEIYFEFYAKRPLADVITFESDESMVALYFAGLHEAESFMKGQSINQYFL